MTDSAAVREQPPLAVDVDGTLTDETQAVDPRVFEPLRSWDAPVVIATGKSLPYPVALCQFVGMDTSVVAENGGVVAVEATDDVHYLGDREAAQRVVDEYVAAGYDLGFWKTQFANRWRETEVAVSRDAPLAPLESLATEHGLEVIDTGYAYHVKDPSITKGDGLAVVADCLELDLADFVAVGDSINDASAFDVVGHGIAVANADEHARAAADEVTERAYADGFLEALESVR
jgi:phosphoglycolate phosphatase (TIGR01487 family)